ncbi:urease accessory protein UreD [Pullulanibacillus sp. KACC 23026]|uniref:urease accessory protein UreD n=1 Tax=Pullulanibacillus sp. KACC 23026 TaxID=3028315 RepID=UPI0023AEF7C2|nr:urease accessory protein UreD [Pullulanibacillus sp. KACC 23026]WEG14784.1 urease accessory protein UreD [Pullulanibacillus sp. KACC 23026]
MTLAGHLQLSTIKKSERSIVSSCYYKGAFKVTRPVYLEDEQLTVYLMHVGGGYVDGDRYLTEIEVGEEAELTLTTQSYTKVYRTPNHPVHQQVIIHLKPNSTLEYLPDPLIAYEGAKFIQETNVSLREGTCLFYKDILTPGWAEDGRLFRYDWIRSRLRVYKNEKLVLFDHLFLEPNEAFTGILELEGYSHFGTFLIFHDWIDRKLKERLDVFVDELDSNVRFGSSLLPEGGLVLRAFAFNTHSIDTFFSEVHVWMKERLLKKEPIFLRK